MSLRKKWLVWMGLSAAVLTAPRFVCGRDAGDFYAGDANLSRELSRSQQRWIDELAGVRKVEKQELPGLPTQR